MECVESGAKGLSGYNIYFWGVLCMLHHFSCVWLCVTIWTVACQVPLSVDFSRQEYWSALPFPPPGDLPNPGIEPKSLMFPALAGGFLTTSTTWGLQSLVSCPAPRPCAPSQSSCSPRAVRCTTLDSFCPYFCVLLWISLDKSCLIFWVTVWFSRLQGSNLSSLTCFVSFTYAAAMLHHLNERK